MGYPISGRKIEKPECLAELLEYARKLSKPFIHARVDFYIVKDKIYFGEITFTSLGGMMDFYTPEFLLKMGGMVDLNYSMWYNEILGFMNSDILAYYLIEG